MKKIIVSVTNDLISDNRVHKVCNSLTEMGFSVLLMGRKLSGSPVVDKRPYETRRFRLVFRKGPCFYAEYNIRLFLFLLFNKADILLSNDLDTLTANYLAAKVKNRTLVYDSHEYFTEVPELIGRPRVKKIWEWLEKQMVPNIKHAYTVCESIAKIYREKYGTPFRVVRNIPVSGETPPLPKAEKSDKKMILYQGAVNVGRGLQQAILAMDHIEGARLIVVGDGDIKADLEELVKQENLQKKVKFRGRLPINQLKALTPQADLGLSIEEDLGLNYRYSLSNKLFDYIRAGVPVLATNLPEMAAIVKKYDIGEITESLEPKVLAEKITDALNNQTKREVWKLNLQNASTELTWENEEVVLKEIFTPLL